MKVFYSLSEALENSESQCCLIFYRRVFFPIFYDFKGSDKWVVFTPGACKRDRPMPIFQRSTYTKNMSANVISLFDPGLFLGKNLNNTWFAGVPARYYGEYVAIVLRDFFSKIGVSGSDVLIFGTSAGGLPAIKIAQQLPNSSIWSGNIQTLAYRHVAFDRMLPVLFPNISKNQCLVDYLSRFDATKMDGNYVMHYFQNRSDVFHYKNHYRPYKDWYESSAHSSKVFFYEYEDPNAGHGSVGRKKEIEIIDSLLRERELSLGWVSGV